VSLYLLLSVPPRGAEPEGGGAVRRVVEVALSVPPVDPGRDHGVTEPMVASENP
jgi:RNA 3'-terminal phosphate cyclase